MSNKTEYRIEYVIQRQRPEDEDFVEIGFGTSNSHSNFDDAVFAIESDVGNYGWETEGDQPDPREIKAAIESERS